ncbi:MAG: NAD(P)/FAD-dependent oxidoreductase [Candidatus Thermoplasmatota archaeon]|nr:NAD(P)/FAD-dependent oxidoreductase [Candidatus Thermoplasmatota archaeon]MBU1940259.1 NAD(P)/FAD-dependent oxidoreductase [Candidatus Thermoplasmatota archaeon]
MIYDVVVVGAGPAGSTAAKFLADQGVKTLLIDKHMYPRDKPCGGVLSVRTLQRFPYIADDLIDAYSLGGSISSSSLRYMAKLQKEIPIAAFVIRKDFDYGLVKYAVQSGATFKDGTTVVDIQTKKDAIQINLNDGEVLSSRLVIGADGIWSVVAKNSGLGQHYPHIGRCLFQEYSVESSLLDQYFTENRFFQFYLKFMGINGIGWVFPKKNSVNIGIGEIQPSALSLKKKPHLKDVYTKYLAILKEKKLIPSTIKIGAMQGGVLPLHPLEKTFADRIVLCGDAAGLMNPLTGDGIHYAMSSGMFAAEVCTEALEADDTSVAFLSKYQRFWKDDFGEEIALCRFLLKRLLKHDDEKYVKLLSKDPQLVDMFLSMMNTQLRIHDYKWKLIKRFIYIYMKDLFGL